MSSVSYDGDIVNSVINRIGQISNTIPSISSGIRSATNSIVSARGFQKYVGGITSDTFSSVVDSCQDKIGQFSRQIRQQQASVLAYSEDRVAINAFLDSLSRSEFDSLDLSAIDSYIGLDRRIGNFFSGIGSTVATFGLGILEGIGNLFETGADLVVLGASGAATIFTGAYDLVTGDNVTQELWKETRAFVSDKKVENVFNSLYNDTEFGQSLKENAYAFTGARNIGSGLGYTAGMIGLNVLTGGIASGLGVGAAGSIGAGQLAATAGLLGFSSGTEDAWNDGAETGAGLLYGVASGAWNAAQWYTGAKINQYGGLGDKIASGIFKGAAKGVGTRIAMDTGMGAVDGFVKPALSMIYKDYGQGNLVDNYKTAFEKAGGWTSVGTNALMGGVASTIGEFFNARKLLKAANLDENSDDAAKHIFESDGGDGEGSDALQQLRRNVGEMTEENGINGAKIQRLGEDLDSLDDELIRRSRLAQLDGDATDGKKIFESAAGGNGSKEALDGLDIRKASNSTESAFRKLTIDGKEVVDSNDCIFKHSQGGYLNEKYFKEMSDGSFVRLKTDSRYLELGNLVDVSRTTEIMNPKQAFDLLEQNKDYLTAAEYMKLKDTIEIFQSYDYDLSMNELKLIAFHSEGSASRIYNIINMSSESIDSSTIDSMCDDLAKKIFKSDFVSYGDSIKKNIYLSSFDDGDWLSAREIEVSKIPVDLIKKAKELRVSGYSLNPKSILPDGVSEETIKNLYNCNNGYYTNIRNVLAQDSAISDELLDYYSTQVAGNVFKSENLLRMAAADYSYYGYVDEALDMVSISDSRIANYNELFKTTALFSEKGNRNAYYQLVDTLQNEGFLDANNLFNIKTLNASALEGAGYSGIVVDKVDLTDASSLVFNYKNLTPADNSPISDTVFSNYAIKHYMNSDGTIDTEKLAKDFAASFEHQNRPLYMPTDYEIDYAASVDAQKAYVDHFTKLINDADNPNRDEAIRFMTTIIKNQNEGNSVSIITVKNQCAYQSCSQHAINLDSNTVSGNVVETMDHETGHCVYHLLIDDIIGEGSDTDYYRFVDIINSRKMAAVSQLNTDTVDTLKNNFNEVKYYTDWKAHQMMDNKIASMGYNNTSRYVDSLEAVYGNRSAAWKEYNKMIDNIADKIHRQEFSSDVKVGSIINSLTEGDINCGYGHPTNYFDYYTNSNVRMRPSDTTLLSFDEMMADYSALKLKGSNSGLRMLKQVVGDDMYDLLDEMYELMLR